MLPAKPPSTGVRKLPVKAMCVRIASVRLLPTVYAAGKASFHGSAQVACQGKGFGTAVEPDKDFRQVALNGLRVAVAESQQDT